MPMTILEGSTFCICDEIGDLDGRTSGFFAEDTRFLSRLELRDQRRPAAAPLLGEDRVLLGRLLPSQPVAEGSPQDSLSIARERFVGDGMQDHLVLRNETSEPLAFELALDVGTDFADIISVKEHDFSLGDPLHAGRSRSWRTSGTTAGQPARARGAATTAARRRRCCSREPGRSRDRGSASTLELAPRERWELRVDVVSSLSR